MKTKLRNLKFAKGMNNGLFANMLKSTVKELYNLQGDTSNAVDAISINHGINTFCEETRYSAKILALTGNKNLERL